MRRARALHSLTRRALAIFGLALALAVDAASAWQNAPAAAATPAPAAAPPAAGARTTGAAAANQQPEKDPCTVTGTVQVTKVRPFPPFEEKTGGAAGPRETPKRTARVEAGKPKNYPVVKLRDTVAVTVTGLDVLLNRERCLEKAGPERNIILYLDRRPLPDVVASPPSDPDRGELMFPLNRTEASREVWTYLLGRPGLDDREVEVSIGIDNQFAVPSNARVYLRVMPLGWLAFWVLIFGVFAVGFLLLARRSDVLRDPVTALPGTRPPYSLARTQAAWWFFLILASYLLIGMITGDFSTSITTTVLVLLGISAGTAAGSAFIDASKTNMATQAQEAAVATSLRTQMNQLAQNTATLSSQVRASGDPATAQDLAATEALRSEMLSRYRKVTNQSEGFLLDVLSDSNGVNFHRFQNLAWTVVLGIIFGSHVYRDLAMPEFNTTLLTLMGISAGTYLGLKIPENTTPNPLPPAG